MYTAARRPIESSRRFQAKPPPPPKRHRLSPEGSWRGLMYKSSHRNLTSNTNPITQANRSNTQAISIRNCHWLESHPNCLRTAGFELTLENWSQAGPRTVVTSQPSIDIQRWAQIPRTHSHGHLLTTAYIRAHSDSLILPDLSFSFILLWQRGCLPTTKRRDSSSHRATLILVYPTSNLTPS